MLKEELRMQTSHLEESNSLFAEANSKLQAQQAISRQVARPSGFVPTLSVSCLLRPFVLLLGHMASSSNRSRRSRRAVKHSSQHLHHQTHRRKRSSRSLMPSLLPKLRYGCICCLLCCACGTGFGCCSWSILLLVPFYVHARNCVYVRARSHVHWVCVDGGRGGSSRKTSQCSNQISRHSPPSWQPRLLLHSRSSIGSLEGNSRLV